jgi:hypothetical protein
MSYKYNSPNVEPILFLKHLPNSYNSFFESDKAKNFISTKLKPPPPTIKRNLSASQSNPLSYSYYQKPQQRSNNLNLTNKNKEQNGHIQQTFPSYDVGFSSHNYLKENENKKHSHMLQAYEYASLDQNQQGLCVRFAVNGLSKFSMGTSTPPPNRNIQSGDFGDDAGMIAENSKCIVIGIFEFLTSEAIL